MSRLPQLHAQNMTTEQASLYDEMSTVTRELFGDGIFIYKDADGAFVGPFGPMLHSPPLVKPFLDMLIGLSTCPGLSATAKETAILTVGSSFGARYEHYAHGRTAKLAGLSNQQIKEIKQGRKPEGLDSLDNACGVAFDVAKELCPGPGPLSQYSWSRAISTLGQEGATTLVQYIAFYAYVCVLLNGVDVRVPEEKGYPPYVEINKVLE